MKGLAREYRATLYATLLTGFQALLYRYTGQDDILVGSPVAGRGAAGLQDLVGYLANPVVLRANLAGRPSFGELLACARENILGAFLHQDLPFPLLVERLQPERDPSRSPVFQAMLVVERSHLPELGELGAFALGEAEARLELGPLALRAVPLERRAAQFDLELMAAESARGLGMVLVFDADLFDPATAERALGHLAILLAAAAEDPRQPVAEMPLLSPAEQSQLEAWNQTAAELSRERCFPDLFREQVRGVPDAVAVTCGDLSLSYAALAAASRRLAEEITAAGLGREEVAIVLAERGPELPRSDDRPLRGRRRLPAARPAPTRPPACPYGRAERRPPRAHHRRLARALRRNARRIGTRPPAAGPAPGTEAERTGGRPAPAAAAGAARLRALHLRLDRSAQGRSDRAPRPAQPSARQGRRPRPGGRRPGGPNGDPDLRHLDLAVPGGSGGGRLRRHPCRRGDGGTGPPARRSRPPRDHDSGDRSLPALDGSRTER